MWIVRHYLLQKKKRLSTNVNLTERCHDTSSTNIRHLTKEDLISRPKTTQIAKREAIRKASVVSQQVSKLVEKKGVQLGQNDHMVSLISQ